MAQFKCPRCLGTKCTQTSPRQAGTILYRLLPTVAVNELLFGQRVPTHTYTCSECQTPQIERKYVFCSNCTTFHNMSLWSLGNSLGNWFGLACPSCTAVIPCLWSFTSLLIVAITLPLWYVPVKLRKEHWIRGNRARIQRLIASLDPLPNCLPLRARNVKWWRISILFALINAVVLTSQRLILQGPAYALDLAMSTIVISLIMGLAIGLSIKAVIALLDIRPKPFFGFLSQSREVDRDK